MSTRTDIYYGYGWDQDVLKKISGEKLFETFKKYMPEKFEKFFENFTDKEITESRKYRNFDILDEYIGDNVSETASRYNIVAEIISEQNDIKVCYVEEAETGDCAVLFLEDLPWYLNEKEKNLTREALDEIFAIYASKLGLSDAVADRCRIETWG